MVLQDQPASKKRPMFGIGALLTLLVGLALTAVATSLIVIDQRNSRQQLFDAISQDITHRIIPFLIVDHGLRGTRGMIQATGGLDVLTAKQFDVYARSRDIGHEFPGTRGIGVAKRVASGSNSSVAALLRDNGWAVSDVWSLEASSTERYVVIGVYPSEANFNALGGDLASEPRRASAIAQAIKTGLPTISAPIELIRSNNPHDRGYIILLPVYRGATVPPGEADRMRTAAGVVVMPVEIESRMALFRWPRDQIELTITDVTEARLPIPLFSSRGLAAEDGLTKSINVEALNRQWQIRLRSTPGFDKTAGLTPWWLIAGAGILITLIAATIAWIAERTLRRIRLLNSSLQQQARVRKAELEEARSSALASSRQLVTMIEENPHGIALVTLEPFSVDEANRRFQELIPDFAKVETLLQPYLENRETGPSQPIEFTTICSVARWLRFSCAPLGDAAGKAPRMIVMVEDVTTEHEQRLLLDEALIRLHIASETAQIGIWYWTFHDDVVQWDDRMFRVFGRTDEERRTVNSSYQYWVDCLHPEDVGAAEQSVIYSRETGKDWAHNYRIICANGDIRTIEAYGTIRRDEAGEPIGMLWVCRDATERLQLEAALIRAHHEAEIANLAKDEFLANVSHELRTPMNAILGLLQILERSQLDGAQRLHVTGAQRAAGALLRILNDILDFSRFETGGIDLITEPLSLRKALDATLELYDEAAKSKGVHLSGRLVGDPERRYWGDELRLGQILHNLVDNAIKFTGKGEVEIIITCSEAGQDRDQVRFEVRDTGPGLGTRQAELLFQPFVQAEPGVVRSHGGSGLGLAICHQLVQAMGGTIGAENNLRAGATFWFELPMEFGGDARLPQLRQLHGGEILIFTLQEDLARLLQGQVSSWGLQATVATSAAAVVPAIASAAAAGKPFDLLLVDAENSGTIPASMLQDLQLAQRNGAAPRLPLILLTGAGPSDDVGITEFLLADAVLTKPVSAIGLYEAIADLQRKGFTERPEAMPTVPEELLLGHLAAFRNARILLVEDNRTNQEVALSLLEQFGLSAEVASNGSEALTALSAGNYALVLMDIHMPVMDGLEAARAIRSGPANAAVPIVAMTAAAFPEDRKNAFMAGMNDFISKPIDVQRLAAVLVRWLRADDNTPDAAAHAAAVSTAADNPLPTLENFDLEALQRRIGGGPARVKRVLDAFREDFTRWSAQADTARQRGDMAALGGLVHTLKGAASGVAATQVSLAATSLDGLLRGGGAGALAGQVEQGLASVDSALAAALAELEQLLSRRAAASSPGGKP